MSEFQLTLKPTEMLVEGPEGFVARRWEGETPNGVPVECLISQVRCMTVHAQTELEEALTKLGSRPVRLQAAEWYPPISARDMIRGMPLGRPV